MAPVAKITFLSWFDFVNFLSIKFSISLSLFIPLEEVVYTHNAQVWKVWSTTERLNWTECSTERRCFPPICLIVLGFSFLLPDFEHHSLNLDHIFCVCWSLSHIQLFATPRTISHQATVHGVTKSQVWLSMHGQYSCSLDPVLAEEALPALYPDGHSCATWGPGKPTADTLLW